MQIRVANRQDEPAIRAIVNEALKERGKSEVEIGGADHDLSNIDAQYFWYDGIFLVAEDEGTIVGLVGARRGSNEQTLEIRRLAVHPQFRGRGLAGRLLATVAFFATNMEYRRILLSPQCHGLDPSRARFGFEPVDGGLWQMVPQPFAPAKPCNSLHGGG